MQENSFTTPDGIRIHTGYYPPATDSNRVVLIVHGLSEHFGRYRHVADHLTSAGYHVYGIDHRGHGQSDGERIHVDSHTQFINDLKIYVNRIQANLPNADFFMLGHSMGSVICLQFVLENPDIAKGLVVTGTATDVASGVPTLLRTVGNIVSRIYSKAPISAPDGNSVLTRDPEMLKQAEADPLFYKGWTKASIAKYILDTGEMIQGRASDIKLPILIMHGESDELTPISGSHYMYEHVGSEDKTLKTYPEMFHEILNEIGREEVMADVTAWLDAH